MSFIFIIAICDNIVVTYENIEESKILLFLDFMVQTTKASKLT